MFKTGSGDDAHPIAAKEDTPPVVDGKPVNGKYTLSLKFLRKMNNEDVTNIDLYILANTESTNANLKGKTLYTITRKDLKELTFTSPFGIKGDGSAETTAVPANGLPISRAITNIDVNKFAALTEAEAQNKSITIPLVRAVSKLHFYFARKADGNTENVKVTKIEVAGNTIPTASYIFPNEENMMKQMPTSLQQAASMALLLTYQQPSNWLVLKIRGSQQLQTLRHSKRAARQLKNT